MDWINIVITGFDGLNSKLTGAGVVVRSIVEEFEQLIAESRVLTPSNTRLFALTAYLREDAPDLNRELRDETQAFCRKWNGDLITYRTYSDGYNRSQLWSPTQKGGGYNQWLSNSLSVANVAMMIERQYGQVLLITHDTPFAQVSRYLMPESNVKHFWVPHSMGAIFFDNWSKAKARFERVGLKHIVERGDSVGATTEEFDRTMRQEVKGIKKPLRSYLLSNNFISMKREMLDEERQSILARYQIPADKKLIFVWGRCVPQKGWDITLPTLKRFFETPEHQQQYHAVLLMPTGAMTNDYAQNALRLMDELSEQHCTKITTFDYDLPSAMLNSRNLDMVLLTSRWEGMSLVALEIYNTVKTSVAIVYSDIHYFNVIFPKMHNSFQMPEFSSDALYDTVIEAVETPRSEQPFEEMESAISTYAKAFDAELERK
ncbi:glycosyltransferase [Paraneptunicella aestuarii]|uniref:glycosyltransferase n=1 Tax=Paraneptunicella aestuarii TaxID=2831148 RepID=UPI001E4DA980|nr:glycosyltransferase [Paraneptunicella aestuarii]UAA40602.1 glycosyltransferase [Paraneptunicella aestuarii]